LPFRFRKPTHFIHLFQTSQIKNTVNIDKIIF